MNRIWFTLCTWFLSLFSLYRVLTVYYELTIMSYSMLEETIITLSGWAPAIIQSSQFINYNSMCILRSLPFNNLFFLISYVSQYGLL